jgi:UDP-N-acetylglucosamine:LPS N-acetylglucosamine transferase
MKVGVIAAKTGNGHISVANALKQELKIREIDAEVFESFYEDLMISNKILSDYYNFLMATSIPLCHKFSELSYISRPDISEDFYLGVEPRLKEFLMKHDFDVLISTSHTINPSVLRALKELNLNRVRFYVVVTDPFYPISLGFDAVGAAGYYCSSNIVKKFLEKKIDGKHICQISYPVNKEFLRQFTEEEKKLIYKKLKLSSKKKTLLINSGSQGAFHYIDCAKAIIKHFADIQVIFICGRNEGLYALAEAVLGNRGGNVRILRFIHNMNEILAISDMVLTKPGANAFFECVFMRKPMIIEGLNGFLYQEKGVVEYLKEYKVGIVINQLDQLANAIEELLAEENYSSYMEQLNRIPKANGAKMVIEDILNC